MVVQQSSSVSKKPGLRDTALDHLKRRRGSALSSSSSSSSWSADENAAINIANVYQQNDEFTSPDLDRVKKAKIAPSPGVPSSFRRRQGETLKSTHAILSPKPSQLRALKNNVPKPHLPQKPKPEDSSPLKPFCRDEPIAETENAENNDEPSLSCAMPVVDDAAVLSALRSIISTMEANDATAKINESNFHDADELQSNDFPSNQVDSLPNNPSIDDENRRESTTSTISTVSHHSERSSLICVENIPVTDEYVSVVAGDKDIVAETVPPKLEKVLVFPRTEMLERAMGLGLAVVDISDRWERNNHTYFVLSVQVLQVPGVMNNGLRMMVMKRFSEFKELRHNLMNSIEASSGSIPPLPTRQVLSLGYDENADEKDYLDLRQRYLRNWLNAIMARQSVEGESFRKTLADFFSK